MKLDIKELENKSAVDLLALAYELCMKYGSNNCEEVLDILEIYYRKSNFRTNFNNLGD